MAIVGDRRKRFQKEIDRLESQQDTAAKMVHETYKHASNNVAYELMLRLYFSEWYSLVTV